MELRCDTCGDRTKSERRTGYMCGRRIVTQEARYPDRPQRTEIYQGTLVPIQQPGPRPRP